MKSKLCNADIVVFILTVNQCNNSVAIITVLSNTTENYLFNQLITGKI